MGAPLRPRAPTGPTIALAPSVRAIVLGDQPEVLSMLNALLRSEGAQIVEQTSDPRDLSDDAGRRADVVFIEAVGLHGSRWKDLLHDARRRLPDARIVLVTRGPGRALEGPARLEGADGLVKYPIQREALTRVLTSLFPSVAFLPDKTHVSGAYARPRKEP
jgi:response regulator RpfG family c-di-GMP phosphodiesterase